MIGASQRDASHSFSMTESFTLNVFRFLRSASAKTETQKKIKYRCEGSHLGYRLSPIIVTPMRNQSAITEADIWQALRDVPDPEIPIVNLVDLGVILRVELDQAAKHARVL